MAICILISSALLGHEAKKRNDEFNANYAKLLNTATANFVKRFCHEDGAIDWDKLYLLIPARKNPNSGYYFAAYLL